MKTRPNADVVGWKCLLSVASILLWGALTVRASDCQPPTIDVQSHIETYLGQRYIALHNRDAKPTIKSTELVPNSCFWKIELTLAGVQQPVTVYLSPDHRFITSALYDFSVNPSSQDAKISRQVNDLLLHDSSPRLAGSQSQITLVEFSDLQCPFCKRFFNWYESLPADLRNRTTLVYKHFPLPQHPWARMAAEYTACADATSPSLFWRVTDGLFERQSEITAESLEAEVIRAFTPNEEVKLKNLKACVTSGKGAAVVDRDIAAAKQLAVSATPTLFLNGRKVMHIQSEKALEELIRSALPVPQAGSDEKPKDLSRSMQ